MYFLSFLLFISCHEVRSTDRPIIGILSQAIGDSLASLPEAEHYSSLLVASNVKWVEAGGAQVVPVIVDTTGTVDQTDYFKQMFSGINGLLIPGGSDKAETSGYSKASWAFYQMAKEANDGGDFFPIFGICLGLEMLGLITNNGQEYLTRCDAYLSVPLQLEDTWTESRLYGQAPGQVLDSLTSLPITVNKHHWCLTRENFTKFEMGDFWKLLSVNSDLEGLEFVSSMEARNYPFYALQYHPEKNSFTWTTGFPIPHSREATHASLYLAQFLADLARQSNHSFPSRAEEEAQLIYNHPVFFSGREEVDAAFTEVYLFN